MAFPLLTAHRTPRWADAPEPAVRAAGRQGSSAGAPDPAPRRGRGRRGRLLLRAVPALVVLAAVGIATAWATGPSTMGPAEVARAAHDQVVRDAVRRTGDYSMTIGPLDCIELEPGRGNCLADAHSATHRTDGLMVAVGYDVDPATGQLELVVKLP